MQAAQQKRAKPVHVSRLASRGGAAGTGTTAGPSPRENVLRTDTTTTMDFNPAFVGLDDSLLEPEVLNEHFSQFGVVSSCTKEVESGKIVIQFADRASAEAAIKKGRKYHDITIPMQWKVVHTQSTAPAAATSNGDEAAAASTETTADAAGTTGTSGPAKSEEVEIIGADDAVRVWLRRCREFVVLVCAVLALATAGCSFAV